MGVRDMVKGLTDEFVGLTDQMARLNDQVERAAEISFSAPARFVPPGDVPVGGAIAPGGPLGVGVITNRSPASGGVRTENDDFSAGILWAMAGRSGGGSGGSGGGGRGRMQGFRDFNRMIRPPSNSRPDGDQGGRRTVFGDSSVELHPVTVRLDGLRDEVRQLSRALTGDGGAGIRFGGGL